MFYDAFSDFGTIAVDSDTLEAISDVIDLGATPTLRSLSFEGMHLKIVVAANTSDAAQDITLTLSLESDSTVGLATSATTHWKTEAIAVDNLTAGMVLAVLPLPVKANYERYLGVRVVAVNPNDAGVGVSVTAKLVAVPDINPAYPAGTQ